MPIYGDEKARQMARSILPSTARKGALDDLNEYRRTERKRGNDRLQKYRNLSLSEAIETYEDDNDPLDEWRSIPRACGWDDPVWERRANDKVAPIMRWAEAVTKDMPEGTRLDYLRTIMPNNKIGRHAVSHCRHIEPPRNPFEYGRLPSRLSEYRKAADERREREAAQIRRDLNWIIESGLHRRFNQILKSRTYINYPYGYKNPDRYDDVIREGQNCNLLGGIDDIEDFIRRNGRSDSLHRAIAQIKKEQGVL